MTTTIFLIPSGYSVSSGKFLGEKQKTYYVSGAPRAGVKYQGKVTSQLHEVTSPLTPFIPPLPNISTWYCMPGPFSEKERLYGRCTSIMQSIIYRDESV
jgi:hypothetical protein